jgi:integrase
LQSRLGHSSIKTTLDIYGHLYEPLDEIVADRLEQLIADAIAHGPRTRAVGERPRNSEQPLRGKGC